LLIAKKPVCDSMSRELYSMYQIIIQHEISNKLYEVDSIAYWWFIIYIGLVKICNICEEL
jgi:hypothetical protein